MLIFLDGGISFAILFSEEILSKTEIEQIQYVNHQAEDSLSSLLEQMPVGVVKLNMESSEIEWFNPYAELMLTTEDGEIDHSQVQEIIKTAISSPGIYANVGEKRYAVHLDKNSGVLYFLTFLENTKPQWNWLRAALLLVLFR